MKSVSFCSQCHIFIFWQSKYSINALMNHNTEPFLLLWLYPSRKITFNKINTHFKCIHSLKRRILQPLVLISMKLLTCAFYVSFQLTQAMCEQEVCITVSAVVGNLFYSKSCKGCFQLWLTFYFTVMEIVNKITLKRTFTNS